MGYVVLFLLIFCGCCFYPRYRRVYCDSMECIERLSVGCKIIEIKERRVPPKYRAKVYCPETEKNGVFKTCKDCD